VRGGRDYLAACLGGANVGGDLTSVSTEVTLDRCEDNDQLVFELPNGDTFDWPVAGAPSCCHEGDKLIFRVSKP
jgi:hypothetical protein